MDFKSKWDNWSASTVKIDKTPLVGIDKHEICPTSTAKADNTPSATSSEGSYVNQIWWTLRNMKEEKLAPRLEGNRVLCVGAGIVTSIQLLNAIASSKKVLLHWLRHPFSKLRDFEIEFFARAFAYQKLSGPFQIYFGPDLYACFEGVTAIVPDGVAKSELQSLFPYSGEPLILESGIVNSTVIADPIYIEELSSAIVLPTAALEWWFESQLANDSNDIKVSS